MGLTAEQKEQGMAGAGSFALDVAGMGISYGLGQAAANAAWDRQKDAWVKGPGYRMLGLEKAGLNPILAAKGSLGGGGTSIPPVASGGAGGASGAKAVDAAMRNPLFKAQVDQVEGSADLTRAQAEAIRAKLPLEKTKLTAEADQIGAQMKLTEEQTKKLKEETELIRASLPRASTLENFWSVIAPDGKSEGVDYTAALLGAVSIGGLALVLKTPFGRAFRAGALVASKRFPKQTAQLVKMMAKAGKTTPAAVRKLLGLPPLKVGF